MFFFQFVLLLGYCYAHALVRLPVRPQPAIHGALLAMSLALLPIVASLGQNNADAPPAVRLLALLTTTVGLPYFLLATTSPLIQWWYARTQSSLYRLFALSNAASLIGLLAYPFLLEPWLTTLAQARLWSAGYAVFVICCSVAAVVSLRAPEKKSDVSAAAPSAPARRPEAIDVMTWVALAALGSLVLVSVTAFIAANVASAPLIWIGPLTLYLVTFILAFEGRRVRHGWSVGAAAVLFSAAMLAVYRNEEFVGNYVWSLTQK